MPMEIVPGTEVQTQVGAVKMDPGAFRRAALARGDVGGTIGQDVGSIFNQVSDRMQQLRNSTYIVDADNKVKEFNQAQQAALAKNPDPTTWTSTYNENFKQFKNELIANPKYGPEVRNHISNMLTQSQANMNVHFNTASNLAEIQENKRVLMRNSELAINNFQKDEAIKAYNVGLSNGALNKYEYADLMAQLPKRLDMAEVNSGLVNDPIQLREKFNEKDKDGNYSNFKTILGKDRTTLSRQIEARFNYKQNENAKQLSLDLANATNLTTSEKVDMIQNLAKNKQINELAAQNFTRAVNKQDEAFQLDIANTITSYADMLITPGAANKDDYKQALTDFTFLLEDPKVQDKVLKSLDNTYNKAVKPETDAKKKLIQSNLTYGINKIKDQAAKFGSMLPMQITATEKPRSGWGLITNFFKGEIDPKFTGTRFQGNFKDLQNLYKRDPVTFASEFGQDATPEMIYNAYTEHLKDSVDNLTNWANNPQNENDAQDRKKVDEHISAIIRPYMLNVTKKALGLGNPVVYPLLGDTTSDIAGAMYGPSFDKKSQPPVNISSKEEFDALPKGTSFIFNGRSGVKN